MNKTAKHMTPQARYEVWREKPIEVARPDGRGMVEIPATEPSSSHASLATAHQHGEKNKAMRPDARWSVLDTENGDEWYI